MLNMPSVSHTLCHILQLGDIRFMQQKSETNLNSAGAKFKLLWSIEAALPHIMKVVQYIRAGTHIQCWSSDDATALIIITVCFCCLCSDVLHNFHNHYLMWSLSPNDSIIGGCFPPSSGETHKQYMGKKNNILLSKRCCAFLGCFFRVSTVIWAFLYFQLGTRFLLPHQRKLLHALTQNTPIFFLLEANSCLDVSCSTEDGRLMHTILGWRMGGWTFFILSAVQGPLQIMWRWGLSWRGTPLQFFNNASVDHTARQRPCSSEGGVIGDTCGPARRPSVVMYSMAVFVSGALLAATRPLTCHPVNARTMLLENYQGVQQCIITEIHSSSSKLVASLS